MGGGGGWCHSNVIVQLEENDFIRRGKTDTNGSNNSGGSDLTSWTRLEELHSCSTSFQCFSSLSTLQITAETGGVQSFESQEAKITNKTGILRILTEIKNTRLH